MALRDLRGQHGRRSPDELIAHLKAFELTPKFSVGVWYFSPMASRFHDKYGADLDIRRRLDLVAGLKDAGVTGVEAHYPAEISEDNLDLWKQFSRETGIRLITVIPGLFYDREFEFGSLSSPLPAARRRAIERTITSLRLNKELDTDFAVVWPGIDGYESSFGQDFAGLRRRFAEEGVDIGKSASQVMPVLVNNDAKAFGVAEKIQERGLFLQPVMYPAVPKHRSRLRVSISAAHSEQDLEQAVQTIASVLKEQGIIK